ncbi:unnamed protein product [Notodromas monacha]|uniref:Uncharacterized protein n=1 Tax=Notodromas monacha TaxID=399045 RepID=A0A7R9BT17_9CRUS|nr:unnamed protein product [Notodromas monacha]CAG0921216.1 unnamed protein product [Notodromas monacha]
MLRRLHLERLGLADPCDRDDAVDDDATDSSKSNDDEFAESEMAIIQARVRSELERTCEGDPGTNIYGAVIESIARFRGLLMALDLRWADMLDRRGYTDKINVDAMVRGFGIRASHLLDNVNAMRQSRRAGNLDTSEDDSLHMPEDGYAPQGKALIVQEIKLDGPVKKPGMNVISSTKTLPPRNTGI